MKRNILTLFLLFLISIISFSSYSIVQTVEMNNLNFIIDYSFKEFAKNPINVEGRIMLPMREFFEAIGANVEWSDNEKKVTGTFNENKIILGINSESALVNSKDIILDTPPVLLNGTTYIPLRFAAESLGYEIIWNEEFQTIYAFSDYEEIDLSELEQSSQGNGYLPKGTIIKDTFTGTASWYGGIFHGRYTANDEIFDQYALTGAHRTLPFGTFVRVTHTLTNQSVIIRINDRGPHVKGRIIDLSMAAADLIGLKSRGLGEVSVEVLENYY